MELSSQDRGKLGFCHIALANFIFLEEMGFVVGSTSNYCVEYLGIKTSVLVYHDQQSYEIGCRLIYDNLEYHFSEIIKLYNKTLGAAYRYPVASTRAAVQQGVISLRDLFVTYAIPAAKGDVRIFLRLADQRNIWAKDLELRTKTSLIKQLADEAFREKDYEQASSLYEQIRETLTESGLKKLDIANRETLK